MRILFGASGAGKSVILKLALGLLKPDAGAISVNGLRVDQMPEQELLKMRAEVRRDHPFLIWAPFDAPARRWSYGEFHERVGALAAGLGSLDGSRGRGTGA